MHGTLMIRQENDAVRHRITLVARLSTRSASAKVAPLYDTMLLTSTGGVWTLAGYVRIAGGALQHEYSVAQSWIVTPAPLEDLRKAGEETLCQRW